MTIPTRTEFKTQIADGSRKLYGFLGKNVNDYHRIFAAKRIYKTDLNDCIIRNDWKSGSIYSYYTPSLDANSPKDFYVNTYQNGVHKVFKCLDNYNKSPSTIDPFNITRFEPIRLKDGYMWILMYQFTDLQYKKFQTNEVIPIYNDTIISSKARPGIIHNVVVTNGGVGYTSAVVTIIGSNNVEARAVPIIINGRIDRIDVTDVGVGYISGANVTIVGNGVGATAIVPTAPLQGHGYDCKAELFCDSVAISQSVSEDTDYAAIPYGLKYNEFGILQDIDLDNTSGDYRIRYIDVINGGGGYDWFDKPVIDISGGFDIGQTNTINGESYAVVTDEKIVAAILTNKGKNYRSEPTVTITHPNGSGAATTIQMESIMLKNLDILKMDTDTLQGNFIIGEMITDDFRTNEAVIQLIIDDLIYIKPISGDFSVSQRIQGLTSNAFVEVFQDEDTKKDFVFSDENILITEECVMLTRQEDQPERLHFVLKF